jgi:predicted nucleotidyltransferase component of viral defense system
MSNAMQFKARIKNLALKNHVSAQAVLQNFMLERLLERISLSRYRNRIILKGGMLVASMVGISNRTTMDMDATLKGYPFTEEKIGDMFGEICAISLDDEVELVFDHIGPIHGDDEYGGFRVAIIARYAFINTPLKIDITFGDVITPSDIQYAFSSHFEEKLIMVRAYNIETILAEKVETILRRSVLNTRSRDFYDVYVLMKTHSQIINFPIFRSALQATAEKRQSLDALRTKEKIIQTIQADADMQHRWERYCQEYHYANGIPFEEIIEILISLVQF